MTIIAYDSLQLPVDPGERARLWRDYLAPVFDIEFGSNSDLSAPIEISTALCADAIIGKVNAPPQRLERGDAKIAQQGLDHLLFQFYRRGSSVLRVGRRECRVDAQCFLVVDLSRPIVIEAAAVDAINLIVSRRAIVDMLGGADHLHGLSFDIGDDPASRMLRSYLRDLVASLGTLPAEKAAMMSRAAVALCCACLPIAGREARSSTPMAKLAIRQYVETAIGDPALSIAQITGRFGLSRSSLERLFEPDGGFARYVGERRLQRALAVLARGGGRGGIKTVARAHGYTDVNSFGRAFARRFGVSPRQVESIVSPDRRSPDDNLLLSWMNQIVTS